jgi:prophage regulatory protein
MSETTIEMLRIDRVMSMLGVCKATVYNWIREGDFPLPFHLGPRNVGWRSDEIQDWIKSRPRVEPRTRD